MATQTVNDSIRLYYFHYLNKTDARSVKAVASDSIPEIIQETKHLIRLKHYSYSTERTYLQWIERFLGYVGQTVKKTIAETDASDFKNFISHLALVQRVSASTQNQAVNAILFFFRYVLGKEVGNLADTVRAKCGQKLPVVFSVEEVKRLLVCMTIHKSQGKTFENVVIDVGRGTFAHGQMYVPLSRCITLAGIVLKQPLKKSHILMDWQMVKFLTGI